MSPSEAMTLGSQVAPLWDTRTAATVGGASSQWRVVVSLVHRGATLVDEAKRRSGSLLELAPLALRQAAPDAEPLIVTKGVLEAFTADVAGQTDPLGLARRTALFREERLGVRLRAKGTLLPHEFFIELRRQTQIE